MSYPIQEVQGISPDHAGELSRIGINTVEELLENGGRKSGRTRLAELTRIPEALILKWVGHADLMRVDGISGQFAELLEAAGVETVRELRIRVPENLYARIKDVNETKDLVGRVPSLDELKQMIELAKSMSPGITY